jgi:hypothetical protein
MIEVLVLHERTRSRIGIADRRYTSGEQHRSTEQYRQTHELYSRSADWIAQSFGRNVGHTDLAGDEPQPPNLARRQRVRRTGVRAGVRPCRGAARAYIYDVRTKIAIINPPNSCEYINQETVRQIPLPIPCQPDFGAQNSAAKILGNLTPAG